MNYLKLFSMRNKLYLLHLAHEMIKIENDSAQSKVKAFKTLLNQNIDLKPMLQNLFKSISAPMETG